jgi:hypothetical protein
VNQPALKLASSRTKNTAPLPGFLQSKQSPAYCANGDGHISFTTIAPVGIGSGFAGAFDSSAGRFFTIHACMSGEYQTRATTCVVCAFGTTLPSMI